MTPTQIKNSTIKQLVTEYKSKARCVHSNSIPLYNELERRLGSSALNGLRVSVWHMEHGEGDYEFNIECDKALPPPPTK